MSNRKKKIKVPKRSFSPPQRFDSRNNTPQTPKSPKTPKAGKSGRKSRPQTPFNDISPFQTDHDDSGLTEISKSTEELLVHYTEKYEKNEILHMLVDDSQLDVLEICVKTGKYDLEVRDERNRTPLVLAIKKGDFPMVRLLVELGADVNCHEKFGWKPIHICAYEGENENMLLIMKLLLDKGVDIDHAQMTALHLAAISENADILWILLERGAQRYPKSAKGQTPADVCSNASLRKTIRKFTELQIEKNQEEIKKKKEVAMRKRLKRRMKAAKNEAAAKSRESTLRSTKKSTGSRLGAMKSK